MLYIHFSASNAAKKGKLGPSSGEYASFQQKALEQAKQDILRRSSSINLIAGSNDANDQILKSLVENVVINNDQFDAQLQQELDMQSKKITAGSKVSNDSSYQSMNLLGHELDSVGLEQLSGKILDAANELVGNTDNILNTIERDMNTAFAEFKDLLPAYQAEELLKAVKTSSGSFVKTGNIANIKIDDGTYPISKLTAAQQNGYTKYLGIKARFDQLSALVGSGAINRSNQAGVNEGAKLIGQIGGIFSNVGKGDDTIAAGNALVTAYNQLNNYVKDIGPVVKGNSFVTYTEDPAFTAFLSKVEPPQMSLNRGNVSLTLSNGSTSFAYNASVITDSAKFTDSKKLIGEKTALVKIYTTTLQNVFDNAASKNGRLFNEDIQFNLPAVQAYAGDRSGPSKTELQNRWTNLLDAALALSFADFLIGDGSSAFDSTNIIVYNGKVFLPATIAAKVLENPNLLSMAFGKRANLRDRAKIAESYNEFIHISSSWPWWPDHSLALRRSAATENKLSSNFYGSIIQAKLDLMESALLI